MACVSMATPGRRTAVPGLIAWMGVLWLLAACAGAAEKAETAEQFDERITRELAASHPDLVAAFTEANAAREAGDIERAAALYQQVRAAAPEFDHAARRLAHLKLDLGHRDEAISLAREALATSRSANNLAVLADILASSRPDHAASAAEVAEAARLVAEARALEPSSHAVAAARVHVAFARRVPQEMRDAVHGLLDVAPDDPGTHYVAAMELASRGEIEAARGALARARQLGLPEDAHRALESALDEATPWWVRAWRVARWLVPAWVGGMLALLACGLALSASALRVAATPPQGGVVTTMSPRLRRVYQLVLWLSCAYYYVSLPIVVLIVVALGAGIIFGLLALGRVPMQIVLVVIGLVLASLFAVLRGLFVRARDEDPGERLDIAAHPRLDAVLREVAQRVGTAVVDDVFLTPGTELAVFERGGMLRRLRGRSRRCLILGAGILEGMSLHSFKSVLAHEYGHLTNRDTAGGGFALGVRNSMTGMAHALAENGAATWYSPTWLFIHAYCRIFLRISQGASRLQEVMADRWAVQAYGSAAFVDGLGHVVNRSVLFEAQVNSIVRRCMDRGQLLTSIYAGSTLTAIDLAGVKRDQEAAFSRPSSPYDSHPPPADRAAWARALEVPAPPGEDSATEPAWSLLTDRSAIEERMTACVQRKLTG